MVFTDDNLTAFFQGAYQMAIPDRTRDAIASEGITTPEGFFDFKKDGLESVFSNLRKPARIPTQIMVQQMIAKKEKFQLSSKSKTRIMILMLAAKYYEIISHPLTPDNMHWTVLKNFDEQWVALKNFKDAGDAPLVPKFTRGSSIHKWI